MFREDVKRIGADAQPSPLSSSCRKNALVAVVVLVAMRCATARTTRNNSRRIQDRGRFGQAAVGDRVTDNARPRRYCDNRPLSQRRPPV